MKRIRLGASDLESSRLVYGCMRIAGDGSAAANPGAGGFCMALPPLPGIPPGRTEKKNG